MRSATFAFEAIGTHWVIDCYEIVTKILDPELNTRIISRIEEFDSTYSRFRDDSLVWKISQEKGEYVFPEDAEKFFRFYNNFYHITGGKFTLLIGNTLNEAGYDSSYSLTPKKINRVPSAESVFSYNHPILKTNIPYILDFGGLGKGYLIDIIANLLKEEGVVSFCIDAGGDIFYETRNSKPLTVGLEHPANKEQIIGVIKINNESICASSGNRRAWDKYHHIIDPEKLESPREVLSTWVIAKESIIADGIATSLFLTPPNKLKKYFDFEYLILYPDYTFEKSKGFNAELFIKSKK